ncbi:unannotated protein [freshwater metagenome]|uniref:Unannotated protein n=1 Tax=freshwater metagenome TaxID=449393 RepID=A0A6J6FJH4_9ZZZZ
MVRQRPLRLRSTRWTTFDRYCDQRPHSSRPSCSAMATGSSKQPCGTSFQLSGHSFTQQQRMLRPHFSKESESPNPISSSPIPIANEPSDGEQQKRTTVLQKPQHRFLLLKTQRTQGLSFSLTKAQQTSRLRGSARTSQMFKRQPTEISLPTHPRFAPSTPSIRIPELLGQQVASAM